MYRGWIESRFYYDLIKWSLVFEKNVSIMVSINLSRYLIVVK